MSPVHLQVWHETQPERLRPHRHSLDCRRVVCLGTSPSAIQNLRRALSVQLAAFNLSEHVAEVEFALRRQLNRHNLSCRSPRPRKAKMLARPGNHVFAWLPMIASVCRDP